MNTYYVTFKSISHSYDATGPDIPSPARVLGALLSAAYNLSDDKVIAAVRALSHCPASDIIVSEIPQVSYEIDTFQTPNLEGASTMAGVRASVSLPGLVARRDARRQLSRRLSEGAFFSYKVVDGPDPEHIQKACDAITYLGKGSDFFTAFVDKEAPRGIRLEFYATARSGIRLRMWNKTALGYYDMKHELVDKHKYQVTVPYPSGAEGTWRVTTVNTDTNWWPVPVSTRLRQHYIPELLKDIRSSHSAVPIPAVDLAGMVQGVLIPFDVDGDLPEINPDSRWFDLNRPLLQVHKPEYWARESSSWMSATPLIGHPDPNVVVWELAQLGFTVKKISPEPFHHSQGEKKKTIPTPTPYTRWWVKIEGYHSGVLQLGQHTEQGAGLMRSVHRKKD